LLLVVCLATVDNSDHKSLQRLDAAIHGLEELVEKMDPWIQPPDSTQVDNAFVTYVGAHKQVYIDGAAMLGQSLKVHAPNINRYCLVLKEMSDTAKETLRTAGWTVIDTNGVSMPSNVVKQFGAYWDESYAKINAFRLRAKKVVFLDADTIVRSPRVMDLFDQPVDKATIAMVFDCCSGNHNSGMMVLAPDLHAFHQIHIRMKKGNLDQPAINEVFQDHILKLDHQFNVHGNMVKTGDVDWKDTVVAHFTGIMKPSAADLRHLVDVVKEGNIPPSAGYLDAPELYREYFSLMDSPAYKVHTPELTAMLDKIENKPVADLEEDISNMTTLEYLESLFVRNRD